jgi:hypothetical protein
MIKKRAILKQLSHSLDRLSNALKALDKKDIAVADENIRTSYNLIKKALEDETKKVRNDDNKKNIYKRCSLLQYIKVIKEDLNMLKIDIKNDNKKSAYNWIDNIRKISKNIEHREKNIKIKLDY